MSTVTASETTPLALFLHGSAVLYGSDKVLLNVVVALRAEGVLLPVVVLNEDGPLRAALAAAGVEVHVATVVKIQRAMLGPALPWTVLCESRRAFADLDRIAGGRSVRLVYSNTLAVLGGAFWARQRGLPHLWHVHEMPSRPAFVSWALPRLASWFSQAVIANSNQTRIWLQKQAPALAGRTSVAFNGLAHTPMAAPSFAQEFRSRLGLAGTDVLVVLAGRINRMKGQDLLIEAASLLLETGMLGRLQFLIVGDTVPGDEALRDALSSRAEALGLGSRVRFLPFTEDIFGVWAAADIAVVPSTEPEAFGLVAIEAMACGRAVVAAAHGGVLDIVEDGVTGVLFPPRDAKALADALARLANDDGLRRRLGEAGPSRQRRLFSLEAQVASIGAVCASLVKR